MRGRQVGLVVAPDNQNEGTTLYKHYGINNQDNENTKLTTTPHSYDVPI